jgi:hypothetical protein
MDSRTLEHLQSQDTDIARRSSVPKRANGPAPIHPHTANRTDTSVGAPARDANSPDASDPRPTDPTKQHGSKKYPKPAIHSSMTGTPHADGGDQILAGAVLSGSTKLPATVKEN